MHLPIALSTVLLQPLATPAFLRTQCNMSEPDFSNTQWVTAQELLASSGIEPGQPLTVDMDHSDVLQVSVYW